MGGHPPQVVQAGMERHVPDVIEMAITPAGLGGLKALLHAEDWLVAALTAAKS